MGEIRDAETARIATESALTGHMVLASIHAISGVNNNNAGLYMKAAFCRR